MAIGGDYQLISSAGDFAANVLADRSIGTIRVASMTTTIAPYIIANADRRGSDGIVDLIQVTGQMGTLGTGGPHIFTGPGGNVRYLVVGGASFNSSKFGGTPDDPITYQPGESVRLTDDSGTAVKLTPTPLVNNTTRTSPADPEFLNPGQLSVLTYGVDDATLAGGKGGVIIMNVTVAAGPADTVTGTGGGNHGLDVETGANGTNGSVEIGNVTTSDAGRAFVFTPAVPATATTDAIPLKLSDPRPTQATGPTAPDATTPIDLIFSGKSTIDVWSITGTGNIDTIDNETSDGEVVNVTATGVGDFAADWIGIAKSHTGVDGNHAGNAVLRATILDDGGTAGGATTPFVQRRNLIHISGGTTPALISARARRGIGNIWVEGIIGNLTADSNGKQGKGGGFDGIDGPILATDRRRRGRPHDQRQHRPRHQLRWARARSPSPGSSPATPSRKFKAARTEDIRGPIVIDGQPPGVHDPIDGLSIQRIDLKGGSIINSPILITSSFNDWQATLGQPASSSRKMLSSIATIRITTSDRSTSPATAASSEPKSKPPTSARSRSKAALASSTATSMSLPMTSSPASIPPVMASATRTSATADSM